MNYFISENINGDPNAGPKARNDASRILRKMGWRPLTLNFVFDERLEESQKRNFAQKARDNLILRNEWRKTLKKVGSGDTLIIQFPVLRRPIALAWAIKSVRRRKGKVICFIHDLELLRYNKRKDVGILKKIRISLEEISVMKCIDGMIVHNDKMRQKLEEDGFEKCKMVSLGIFDYLIPSSQTIPVDEKSLRGDVAIAGTLRIHKSSYLQNLPGDVKFNLYGVGYEDQNKENITYFGSFLPDELPSKLDADFGLVWDGDSSDTCTGYSGEYLRINNPHKTSLYLASGMPVIIWSEAALAEFIKENKCGIVIDSLNEIHERIKNLSYSEYNEMRTNAYRISKQLRKGYNTIRAVSEIVKIINS